MEEGEALVRRLVEKVASSGDLSPIDQIVAADHVEHAGPPGLPSDREVLKQTLAMGRLLYSHRAYGIEGLQPRGDRVLANLRGSPPDERASQYAGSVGSQRTELHAFRIVGGKIAGHWGPTLLFGGQELSSNMPER